MSGRPINRTLRDCSIRTRALPVGATNRMPPASIFWCEHNIGLIVPKQRWSSSCDGWRSVDASDRACIAGRRLERHAPRAISAASSLAAEIALTMS